ncbi:aminoglycoside phosphotransferase family protein [Exiguobacterium sp. Helios]|uniref:phosphotransferase n=1 Tax=Exiguobacterium sp. Helios TaxID=2735868 RepID=UPI00165DC362|nr:aminoglycoside phosphotransferase family protein [Exiguobacterium sp. Helios]QNR21085.1 aminoglycoside phosphotransferase family protein [Exiguobacterium sp. Helios]
MEQTKPFTLINQAVLSYSLDFQSLEVEPVSLTTYGKHGDLHYKILVDERPYSIRLLQKKRYVNSDLSQSTSDILAQQLRYTDYLRVNGIPFMERVKLEPDALFTNITDSNGQKWTCCLFHWMDGQHVTANTRHTAAQIGMLARQLHDVSLHQHEICFPYIDHTTAYQRWLGDLQRLSISRMPEPVQNSFQEYLTLAQQHLDTARHPKSSSLQPVISTDLNSLNILWNQDQQIIGIVDHEHIGATDRVQDLAWLIKWYARTEGIDSHDVSGRLAKSLLTHYNSPTVLVPEEDPRLASLLWLSGCMNLHFVERTKQLAFDAENNPTDYDQFQLHLQTYRLRGERLVGLLT